MPSMTTNGTQVAAVYRRIRATLDASLDRGMTMALLAVERAQVKNLSGGGAPFSYPVPVRTGNLRRSAGHSRESLTSGYVFNTAAYAGAVHSGHVSEWTGRGEHRTVDRTARPFLTDAVEQSKPSMIVQAEISKGLMQAGKTVFA